jgi:CubicO group peptidase (beta-lactamase class C family)
MRTSIPGLLILLFILLACPGCNQEEEFPEFDNLEDELDYLMGNYVGMGAALGIIDSRQQLHTYFYGSISENNPSPPDENSLFDIGSITKTFTATLLAQKVVEGELNLEDRVQGYLPGEQVTMPVWEGTEIRLKHLATHTSGLPRAPRESAQPYPEGYDPYNPYDAYETSHVYDYLNNYCDLEFEPGTGYLYSNTGGGLLGHALGLEDGTSFSELLHRRILEPLGMELTTLDLEAEHLPFLAPGHDEMMDSVANYTANDIFEGAGFIKSSLKEMILYLKANLGMIGDQTPFELAQQHHFEVGEVTYSDREGRFNLSIGLGWHIHTVSEDYSYCYHGGRTNGYMTFMAFDRDRSTGFVVMFNHSIPNRINRIGEELRVAIKKYE